MEDTKKESFFSGIDSIKVSEVMKNAEVVDENAGIEELVNQFNSGAYGEVFVSRKGKVIGVVTLLKLLDTLRKQKDLSGMKTGNLLEKAFSLDTCDSLSKAILVMEMHGLDYVTVTNKKELVGIVTQKSILNKIAKNLLSKNPSKKTEKVESNVDKLLEILKSKETSMNELKKSLDADEEQIEEWLKILESHGLIKVEKHFGKIKAKYVR